MLNRTSVFRIFLGEIFVEPSALVPNARRDGFEEDAAWKRVRRELATVVKALGREAYRISASDQLSVEAQRTNLQNAKKELRQLQRTNFADADKAMKLSTSITAFQKRIAKGSLGADMETLAELQAISAELTDIKREALARVGGAIIVAVDREKVQQEARDEFLREAMAVLEQELSPACLAEVRDILQAHFGDDEV
jgi:molecular chaperone HtpG